MNLENDNPRVEKLRMLKDVLRMYYEYGEIDDDEAKRHPPRQAKYYEPIALRRWIDGQYLKQDLFELLSFLCPRERKIIIMRYGLFSNDGVRTLEEVGDAFDVTRERIRSIEAIVLQKLKNFIIEYDLQEKFSLINP